MARQVLPIVGAIAGGLIAGPTGAQVGFALGSLIGNAVDPLEVQGNKVGDNPLQTASEGGARAIVFGKGCIRATCILERGNRIVRKQREQSGKGGGPVTINERVFWTFAIGLGEDLIGGAILRIWEGEKLVYDVTPGSAIPEETAAFAEKFRFYDGSETQLPDPDLEAIHGVGEAPYYRGTAYVVFPNFDLTDYREAIPVYRWEVAKAVDMTPDETLWLYSQTFGNQLVDAAYGNGRFLLVGVTGAHGYGQIWESDSTGRNFIQLDPPVDWTFQSVAFGEGKFVISRDFNQVLVYSGGAFSVYTTTSTQAYLVTIYSGGYFVRLGFGGTVERSDDGATWSAVSGGIGISDDVRRAVAIGASIIVALTSEELRRSSDSGATWGAVTIIDGDPYPGSPFNSVADYDGVIRAYKEIDSSTLAIYTSADAGATWEVTTHSVSPDEMVGGEVGIVNGLWVTGTISELAPTYPSILASSDGLPPFLPMQVSGGPGTTAYADIVRIVDSQDGVGIALGRQADGTHFTFTNSYESGSVVGEQIPLSTVVSAIHERCGHSASEYDVAELTDLLSGVVFEQSITGAESINSIIGPYFADPSEYDGEINYIKRGDPVVRTLAYDDLTEEPDETQRQNAIEYPRKLHFFFQASTTAYAATKATSSRSSPDLNTVKGEVSVASPITFDGPDEPAQIAAKLHKVNWTDAEGEIEWEVTDEQLDLVPTDCVGLSLRGRVTRARITHIEDTPGRRKLTMRVDRQSAYTSDVTGIPLPTPTPPQPSILSPTINAYMDIPALLDSHDLASPVYYDGMSGQTDVWPGAVLQRSLDDGSTWTNVTATTLNAIMGVLQETVNSASPYYTDTTNQVVVRLYMDDEIESITNAAFLSEQGAFALSWEDSGQRRWEIMQYRDAQQDSSGNWVLTTLHRGRLNTDAVEHPPGATFVLLDTAVRLVTAQSAWINTDLTHRAVTNGLSPESATEQTEPFTAQSQTEWPVAHLFLEQDSAGDTTATVVPRNRFGTSLNPIRSINWTGYRWTVTDGSNTINRDGTSETEVFDTSGWGTVTVTVSQLNRITGPGPSVSESIP